VEKITHKLSTINVQFRKVKGHNNNQWTDAANALAVMWRDQAINWPKCSFDVVVLGGQIPFKVRALRETTSLEELCTILVKETEKRLPSFGDLKAFKDRNPYAWMRISGHYQPVYKTSRHRMLHQKRWWLGQDQRASESGMGRSSVVRHRLTSRPSLKKND
jgi:hypothetical protein